MIQRILGKLGRMHNDFIFSTGIGASRSLRNTSHTILMYHGIDIDGGNRFNGRHTRQRDFFAHLQFLKKHAHIISLQDFFEGKFRPGRPNFAITFDDGYQNNFQFAKPVIEAAKVPATFFITGLNEVSQDILWADFLNIASTLTHQDIVIDGQDFRQKNGVYHSLSSGKGLYEVIKHDQADAQFKLDMMESFQGLYDFKSDASFDVYWKLMSDEEITLCGESPYIEVGSHAYLHNNLSSISHEHAVQELQQSRNYLESLTQQPLLSLGYPDGSYSREIVGAAQKMGFRYQVAAEGFNFDEDAQDERLRDRVGMYAVDTCANQLMVHFGA
jgi:peptidoglycan/xylan/chitin deacetylase (PgdA/CDA1 family)